MTYRQSDERSGHRSLRDAAVTLVTVLLAFAAFDDITTDNATTFTVEWVSLAVCGVSLLIVSCRLLWSRHRWLGSASGVALVVGVGAGSAVRPGTGPFQVEFLTTVAALLWFLGLAGILTGQAWRRADQRAAQPREGVDATGVLR
jgi:hypothetical protein